MPSLKPEEITQVCKVIPDCEAKSVAVAKLYIGLNNRWEYTGIVGALVCCADNNRKSYFLKLVDLSKNVLVWEQEFYEGFVYNAPVSFFHTLESDSTVYGLSFADEEEAKDFFTKVLYCKNTPFMTPEQKEQLKAKIIQTKERNKTETRANKEKEKERDKKKKKNFLAKLFGKEEPSQEIVVSAPTNFRHQGHIGFDPEKGFEISNIPQEWRSLFIAAGIKKSELRNPETAKYVMNVISDAISSESEAEPVTSTLPPSPRISTPTSTSTSIPPSHSLVPSSSLSPPSQSSPSALSSPSQPSLPPPPPPLPQTSSKPSTNLSTPNEKLSTVSEKKPTSSMNLPTQNSTLLEQIRSGTQLRKVDTSRPMPDLSKLAPEKKKTLTEVLASAMILRRADLIIDESPSSSSGNGDDSDEWSD